MNCDVTFVKNGVRAGVKLSGELTIYTVGKVKGEMDGRLHAAGGLVVDLSGLNKIDSAGFQMLLLYKRESALKKIDLSFVSPAEDVQQIFALYGESLR
jgi:anti-sigma B factor antagonist